jgi:hypothetical protein
MARRINKNQGSVPPGPKSPTQREQQQELERSLERYSCVFDVKDSNQIRLLALEKGDNVCTYVRKVMREHVEEARGKTT